MPFDAFESVGLGATGLRTTRLGLGTTAIGGLFQAVSDEQAGAVCEHAWDIGIRTYDTAPHYGYGLAERRLGKMLAGKPRSSYLLSSKVGRLIRPAADVEPVPHRLFQGADHLAPVWDFSRDGVLRSIEESLERLGADRLDIVYLHSPDDHWKPAIEEAYPTLHELREGGTISAIGAGMTQSAMLARFVREADMDVVLCAGRYTLLDQSALQDLLPLCESRGVGVVIGGVLNSGVLADPVPGSTFDYAPASDDTLAVAQRMRAVCERYGVRLRDVAIQFPLAHPAVVTLLAGVRSVSELDDYPAAMRRVIPDELWQELKDRHLIHAGAPVPPAAAS